MLSGFAEQVALISITDCVSSGIIKALFAWFNSHLVQPSEIIGHCSWNNVYESLQKAIKYYKLSRFYLSNCLYEVIKICPTW